MKHRNSNHYSRIESTERYKPPESDENTFVYMKPNKNIILKNLGECFEYVWTDYSGNIIHTSTIYKWAIHSYDTIRYEEKKLFRPLQISYDVVIYAEWQTRFDDIPLDIALQLYDFIRYHMFKKKETVGNGAVAAGRD